MLLVENSELPLILKGEIIEKSLKVYFAANPHFLWKHFVFDDFGITGGISK